MHYREPSGPMRGPSGRTQMRSRSCAKSWTVRSCAADRPRLGREHHQAVLSSVWCSNRCQHTFWRLHWGQGCLDLLKIGPQMVGSKDHTNVSTTNIIKPVMKALPADD
jgi:hypothetical protein